MKYFVKNEHGELTFGSIHELRSMFAQGMVDADDEVRPEDSQVWRKAAAIPELREFAAASRAGSGERRIMLVALVNLSAALYVLFGHLPLGNVVRILIAGALIVPVLVMSQRAFTRSVSRERK